MPTSAEEVLAPIEGCEGAISMAVHPVAGSDGLTWQVTCGSFEPPYCQDGDTGTPLAMAETQAGSGDTASEWQAQLGPLPVGPHDIICYNSVTRVHIAVFAGDIPVWEPEKVMANGRPAGRQAGFKRQAAATMAVTHKLG